MAKRVRLRKGLRVEIVGVAGAGWHGLVLADPHPALVGQRGTIRGRVGGVPLIRLDSGRKVRGSECWWRPV